MKTHFHGSVIYVVSFPLRMKYFVVDGLLFIFILFSMLKIYLEVSEKSGVDLSSLTYQSFLTRDKLTANYSLTRVSTISTCISRSGIHLTQNRCSVFFNIWYLIWGKRGVLETYFWKVRFVTSREWNKKETASIVHVLRHVRCTMPTSLYVWILFAQKSFMLGSSSLSLGFCCCCFYTGFEVHNW